MAHLSTCTTSKRELTGNIWVHSSNPDPACQDKSHEAHYTEATK